MFKSFFKVLSLGSLLAIGSLGIIAPSSAANMQVAFEATQGTTSVPYGWVDFCARYDGECSNNSLAPQAIHFSAENFKEIARINHFVNKAIDPVSDWDHWHKVDQWDIPTDGKGDCEDYALLKRQILMREGFPRQALLMTVVRDLQNEGHAILTVHTDRGDYVLDNLSNGVKLWTSTGYRFVKRQSQSNPNVWESIGAPATELATAAN